MAKIRVTIQKVETTEVEIEVVDGVLEQAMQSAKVADPHIMLGGRQGQLEWSAPRYKVKEVVQC